MNMDKKALAIGVGIGIVGTGVINAIGGIVGAVIARKKAKAIAESILDECTEGDTTPNTCAETEE